jgi:hypothetical protein
MLRLALLLAAVAASAQTRLSIVDALPPYLLSARLLDNGHFSITTRYAGAPKTLIYQDDGSGGPVNYTSHIHFKVDDVVFQLPYELDPVTRDAPPEHPLSITRLYRDTVGGVPRVNARMSGVMPDGDTVGFLFTMHPVLRESGGFIRLIAEVDNTTRRARSIGVLMLVDTKIGDNDRAPIVTSLGYRARETAFGRGVAPGMPEFWLALEGTPTDPRLTARGNLRASGLIEPDLALVGNWKDNTAVPGATGLASALWKERSAFDVEYTDSAVLMVWDEQTMAPGERRVRASTEIGIVDSLDVSAPAPGVDALWIAGSGLASSCLGFDVVRERPCGSAGYSPYAPDSLQALYLVTNRGASAVDGVRIVVPRLPAGLRLATQASAIVPSTIPSDSTGVASLAFAALPRLASRSFAVPIAVVDGAGDTLRRDTICVTVPGLLGALHVAPASFPPVCPGGDDTIAVSVRLDGPRCLELAPDAEIIGAPADRDHFEILTPLPATIPADGVVTLRVRYTAGADGTRHRVGLAVHALDHGLDDRDVDTTIMLSDTAMIEAGAKGAEFRFAEIADTLDLGAVCVGSSALGDWTISNVGGCALSIDRDLTFEDDPLRQFSVDDARRFPMTIGRDADSLVTVRFTPARPGVSIARFIIRGSAEPYVDTLVVRGRGDAPALDIDRAATADTICPGERFEARISATNPTACDVTITAIDTDDTTFAVDAAPITLPPHARRELIVRAPAGAVGRHATMVRISGSDGSAHAVPIEYVVASRALSYGTSVSFGDVRIASAPATRRVTIASSGDAPATIGGVRVAGADAGEFALSLPNGGSFPIVLAPGSSLDVDVTFTPADLEMRHARIVVETATGGVCDPAPAIELEGRGVLPLVDVTKRRMALGRRCVATPIDTMLEIRNRGNAPLTIAAIEPLSSADGSAGARVTAGGLPVVIAPDSVRAVRITIDPDGLGELALAVRVESDGSWFTAPDTLVEITGTSVLCAEISVDTVRGRVGDHVSIPVRLRAPGLGTGDVARLLNAIGATGIELTLGCDGRLVRFTGEFDGGMLAGQGTGATATPAASTVRLASVDDAGALDPSPTIATLDAEVLLGASDRTALTLAVARIAKGYAEITTHDGLLVADYCALDRRYVALSGALIAASSTPLSGDGAIVVSVPSPTTAVVTLLDAAGRTCATLHDGSLAGARALALGDVASGFYTALLRTPNGTATARIVVAR